MEQSHVLNLLIMGSDSTVPVTAADAYIDAYTDLDDGAFSVVNDMNMVLSAVTVLTDDRVALYGVRLVGRYDTKLVYSDFIKADDIITYRGTADAASVEQVTHVGYTGATGAIQVINDNVYKIKIEFWEQGRTGQGTRDVVSAYYISDATATGTEIAFGLEELLRASFAKKAENPVQIEVLNSAAVTAGNAFDNNATVVNGFDTVTVGTNSQYAAGTELAVGDLVRIGTIGAGTALTDAVYYVEQLVSGTVFRVDRPITDPSGVYLTASDDMEVIPAASIANYGFEFTGIARTHTVNKRPYSKVSFTVGIEDFGTTAVAYTTQMSLGHGNPEQIKDLEFFCHGQEGDRYRGDYMYQGYTTRVTTAHMYNQLSITWAPDSRSESIGGPGHNPKQLIIAIDTLYDDGDANDICIDVLDAYSTITSGLAV